MLPFNGNVEQREWHAVNYHRDGGAASTSEITSPIELTKATGMRLLDLNDNCLIAIFSQKSLNTMDLCSVAECCTRLKEIAGRIFAKSNKMFTARDLQLRRIFRNFGSLINEFGIRSNRIIGKLLDPIPILELMVQYCSVTLESLNLVHCRINHHAAQILAPIFSRLKTINISHCYIEVPNITLFSNCLSLVELKINDCAYDSKNLKMIFATKFPKLERFHFYCKYDDYFNLKSFISNHMNLKELYMHNGNGISSSLLELIGNSCKALEKLDINIRNPRNHILFLEHIKQLLNLQNLKELKIKCWDANITDFIKKLPKLTSLELLQLNWIHCDYTFLLALSELKNITALRLMNSRVYGDLNQLIPLARMEQLNELWIIECHKKGNDPETTNFALVEIIERLRNLKELFFVDYFFTIDKNFYLKIADVVRKRPDGFPSFLKLGVQSDTFDLLKHDVRYIQNVKLVKLKLQVGNQE